VSKWWLRTCLLCISRRDVDNCTKAIQQLQHEVATLRKGLLLVHAASVRPQQWAAQISAPQATQEPTPVSGQAPAPEQQPQMNMQMPAQEPTVMDTASGPLHHPETMQTLSAEAAAMQKQWLEMNATEGNSAATLPQMIGPEA
jgi:hypothetical protein